MVYTAPTLGTLRTRAMRVLRDDGTTFIEEVVDDFINEALAELSRFRPIERQVVILGADIERTIPLTTLNYVWAVERVIVQSGIERVTYIPPLDIAVPGHRAGWDYFAGSLDVGGLWAVGLMRDAGAYLTDMTLRVSGYGERERLVLDADVAELESLQEEFAVLKFVGWRGFRALEQDRSLFQQWLTQANNTDVSPTQLMNMVASTGDEWNRMERKMQRRRRPPVG